MNQCLHFIHYWIPSACRGVTRDRYSTYVCRIIGPKIQCLVPQRSTGSHKGAQIQIQILAVPLTCWVTLTQSIPCCLLHIWKLRIVLVPPPQATVMRSPRLGNIREGGLPALGPAQLSLPPRPPQPHVTWLVVIPSRTKGPI